MNSILKMLNAEFPSPKVATIKNYEQTTTTEDPKFYAYKSKAIDSWWIVCTDYFVFSHHHDVLEQVAEYMLQETGVNCMPCHQHAVGVALHQQHFREKKCGVEAFLGRCSYSP